MSCRGSTRKAARCSASSTPALKSWSTIFSGAPPAVFRGAARSASSIDEEVLIARVHPEILRGEAVPEEQVKDGGIWRARYKSIVDLEGHLARNGTRIVKIFLHLSKDEQRKRFLGRIDDPDKRWKFSQADIEERRYWKHYMKAYQECLSATSTAASPWYIVPADDKENARLIVSRIIVDTLVALKMSYPKLSDARLRELQSIRRKLAK
jgi:Polyphosphate kinase 2 (PPK2)